MNATKTCRYCQNEYFKDGREHVFPKGMGGQNIFMDNVCADCNRKFSDYERALMRDSPIAFMRSVEGIEGYRRSDIPSGAFLAPILLSFDEDKKVVYEVGQRYPFENFVRPQILSVQGAFYIEGDTRDNLQNLDKKFAHWKREVRLIVVKTWLNDTESIQWIEFVDNGATYETVENRPVRRAKRRSRLTYFQKLTVYLSIFRQGYFSTISVSLESEPGLLKKQPTS